MTNVTRQELEAAARLLGYEYTGMNRARKPSDEELNELIQLCEADDLVSLDIDLIVSLARAELQRRQQPEASVPAELLEQCAEAVHDAYLETCAKLGWSVKPENQVPYSDLIESSKDLDRASVRATLRVAAAYGRGQSQQNELMRSLARSLKHVMHCRTCGEMSCEDCGGGQDAIDALENYSNYLQTQEPPTC